MFKKSLVLLVLFTTVFLSPVTVAPSRVEQPLLLSAPTIESRLYHEIGALGLSIEHSDGVPALLEFEKALTPAELLMAESHGVRFDRRGSSVVSVGRIYCAFVQDIHSLVSLSELGLLRATSGSKQFIPSLSSSVPAIKADDVWENLVADGEIVNGSGTKVAVIDTGAAWRHPSFWRQFPVEFDVIQSGPDFYLDLDDDGYADPNEGPIRTQGGQTGPAINYGSDYMYLDVDESDTFEYSQGDRWIVGVDENDDNQILLTDEPAMMLNISKIAAFYDQITGSVYFRDVNLTSYTGVGDTDGHGTHVASTIAGGQPGFTGFVGVAPGADLIIIRSPLSSSAIIDGIRFAVENDADVINLSFSSYLGFLDGTDLEDLAVNEAFLEYGIVSVAAAGNLGDKQKHSRFLVPTAASDSSNVAVSNPPDYSYVSVLWHSDDRDEHVILNPPAGNPIDLGEFSALAGKAWALDTDHLSAYVFAEVSTRGLNNIIIQVQIASHFWDNGVWGVELQNPSGDPVVVDVFAWDGGWSTTYMTVASDIDYGHTISSPGTADLAVTVAAYSESGSNILSSSSRGPRVDGMSKPSLAAPGYNIYAAYNRFYQSGYGLWTTKSGTSMASPHVAGAVALLLQASSEESSWPVYSALLAGAGGIASHWDSPSTSWGHGLCDVLHSVMHLLNSSLESGSSLPEWIGVPDLVDDPDDTTILDALDLLSVKTLFHQDEVGFSITLGGTPAFGGSNGLSVEWDHDNDLMTGAHGADILVNITGGGITVQEWSGSDYEPSSLSSEWWVNSEAVFIRLSGIDAGVRGSVTITTYNSTDFYVDSTEPTEVEDYFRPLFTGVIFNGDLENLNITLRTRDIDSAASERAITWGIVDGPLRLLESENILDSDEIVIVVDPQYLETEYANSLLSNVTSEGDVAYLPLVPLVSLVGFELRFSGGSLDNDVVSVGLLSSQVISGQFTLEGFNLAEEVYVAFRHQTAGFWLNFTLTSNDGTYEFLISPSAFSQGKYDVFAIAIGRSVPMAELRFATLTVIQDAGLMLVGAIGIGAVIALIAVRRYRGGSQE